MSFANTVTAIDENTVGRHRHQGRRRGGRPTTRSAARRSPVRGRFRLVRAARAASSTSSARARTSRRRRSYIVTVEADDPAVGGAIAAQATFTLSVTDLNEAPTAVVRQHRCGIDENAAVGTGIKVADVVVTDDALGSETLSLSGADAAFFERAAASSTSSARARTSRRRRQLRRHRRSGRPGGRRRDRRPGDLHARHHRRERGADRGVVRQHRDGDRREHGGRHRHQGRRRGGDRRRARRRGADLSGADSAFLRAARERALLHRREPGFRGEGRATSSPSKRTTRRSAARSTPRRPSRSTSPT